MKKANAIGMFVLLGMFLCLILGMLIGRYNTAYLLADERATDPSQSATGASTIQSHNPSSQEMINLNTATAQQLCQLPGIGQSLAQRILDYREANGGFESIYEMLNIEGIGSARFQQIEDLITTGGQYEDPSR